MLQKKTSQDNVAFGLAVLNYYLRFNSKNNLQDANVSSEELVSKLVNILKDTKFLCTAEIKVNYPGIDALDEDDRQGLQITHENTSKKINETIDIIRNNDVNKAIGVLYFFITSRKQKTYSIKAQCPGLCAVVKNILDFDDLAKLLSKSEERLSRAEALLKKSMPRLYTDGKGRYQAMLDCVLVSRDELDRQVFHASKVSETPEEMLTSLREIRIAIQKGGIMNRGDVIVSNAFREIIRLIASAETEVAEKYNAGFKKYRAGVKPAWDYPEAGDCIAILMNIRYGVINQIDIIDNEIKKLKILTG